jgi:hypothetical protein
MQKNSFLGNVAILAMFLLVITLIANVGGIKSPSPQIKGEQLQDGQKLEGVFPRSKVCTYSFPLPMYCR